MNVKKLFNTKLLIIFLLGGVVVAGLLMWVNGAFVQRQELKPYDDTSAWPIYTHKQFGYQFHYPPGYTVSEEFNPGNPEVPLLSTSLSVYKDVPSALKYQYVAIAFHKNTKLKNVDLGSGFTCYGRVHIGNRQNKIINGMKAVLYEGDGCGGNTDTVIAVQLRKDVVIFRIDNYTSASDLINIAGTVEKATPSTQVTAKDIIDPASRLEWAKLVYAQSNSLWLASEDGTKKEQLTMREERDADTDSNTGGKLIWLW
jgi:hypothetical protein